ncbi:2-oxoacid:acceptor oxidoreductase family protein [bacterium]|nr:2-oxoacid:acceptor oxidoreductase family protein [bacterium]MBU1638628.1 2-oxoacid:acceptor oxidoreductase family protein [bacterium]MBU1921278.1 2-oxoacid:acceptor oxidoreductase family protein [bacterium]
MKEGKCEVRVTGLGGQGVILCSYILGKAAALHGGFNATMTQSFGPEARGSACSAQIIIDKERILDPYLRKQDVLVALSQDGYEKFAGDMNSSAVLIYEKDLVTPNGKDKGTVKAYGIPATRLAQDVIGISMTVNIIMLGFFAAATELVSKESFLEAVKSSVPAGTEKSNLLAFETGYEYFGKTYGT